MGKSTKTENSAQTLNTFDNNNNNKNHNNDHFKIEYLKFKIQNSRSVI